MRVNEAFAKFFLVVLGICVALLDAEIFLRLFPASNAFYYQKMKWNHWALPGRVKEYNDLYVYDSFLGYENKGVAKRIADVRKNDPNSFKILVLGDSISEAGKYVDYFSDLLIAKYGPKFKVVNAGVMGYDIELEYRYLKYRGMDLAPDLVILQFCVNDFNGTPVVIKRADGSWFALNGSKKVDRWINPKLFKISKLYEAISLRALYFSYGKKGADVTVKAPLEKIKRMLDERKIPFCVMVVPFLMEGEYADRAHRKISDILRELGLGAQAIDLLPAYSQASFGTIRRDSIHPNERGDRIAAGVLFEALQPLFSKQFAESCDLAK